jgi:hypothetical protein
MTITNQEPWFIEERAFALACLVLTIHDVAVRPHAGHDMAIDLLAEILQDGKSTLRFFGAHLIGYLDLPSIQNADQRVLSHLGRDPFEAGLPLCVFVIGIRKPEGLYRWVVEPIVDDGRAMLQPQVLTQREVQAKWQPLDDAGAGRLIDQVNAYYDALHSGQPRDARGHNSKGNKGTF